MANYQLRTWTDRNLENATFMQRSALLDRLSFFWTQTEITLIIKDTNSNKLRKPNKTERKKLKSLLSDKIRIHKDSVLITVIFYWQIYCTISIRIPLKILPIWLNSWRRNNSHASNLSSSSSKSIRISKKSRKSFIYLET